MKRTANAVLSSLIVLPVLTVGPQVVRVRAAAEGVSPGPDIHILQGPEVCEDARINVVHPDRNSGANSKFGVFRSNAPIRSLIRFDLSGLAKDTAAKDVALMIYMVGES